MWQRAAWVLGVSVMVGCGGESSSPSRACSPSCGPGEYCDRGVCREVCNRHADCVVGFHCIEHLCVATSGTCGDGAVDAGEKCDDENTLSGDGCRGDCLGFEVCGDGLVDGGEACDDENTLSGDGCRADCLGEEVCGDGLVDVDEACDDENTLSGDGCRADCLGEEVCGDGLLDGDEVCDDGDGDLADGCAACRIAPLTVATLSRVSGSTSSSYAAVARGSGGRLVVAYVDEYYGYPELLVRTLDGVGDAPSAAVPLSALETWSGGSRLTSLSGASSGDDVVFGFVHGGSLTPQVSAVWRAASVYLAASADGADSWHLDRRVDTRGELTPTTCADGAGGTLSLTTYDGARMAFGFVGAELALLYTQGRRRVYTGTCTNPIPADISTTTARTRSAATADLGVTWDARDVGVGTNDGIDLVLPATPIWLPTAAGPFVVVMPVQSIQWQEFGITFPVPKSQAHSYRSTTAGLSWSDHAPSDIGSGHTRAVRTGSGRVALASMAARNAVAFHYATSVNGTLWSARQELTPSNAYGTGVALVADGAGRVSLIGGTLDALTGWARLVQYRSSDAGETVVDDPVELYTGWANSQIQLLDAHMWPDGLIVALVCLGSGASFGDFMTGIPDGSCAMYRGRPAIMRWQDGATTASPVPLEEASEAVTQARLIAGADDTVYVTWLSGDSVRAMQLPNRAERW